jgi:hypothetical protein
MSLIHVFTYYINIYEFRTVLNISFIVKIIVFCFRDEILKFLFSFILHIYFDCIFTGM